MSLTLGEKLRQAREDRGITLSEVAEQTRISALYLENIENNDYKHLPGGIFNKGFVKSYAKYVGVDEQEALADYARLMSEQGDANPEENKTYRPEVLTDDNARSTSTATIVFAIIILALLAGGIFALVRYYQDNQNQPSVVNNSNTNKNGTNSNTGNSNASVPPPVTAPSEIKAEFKATTEDISLTYWIDGKISTKAMKPNETLSLTAPQSLKLSYSKYRAQSAQLTLNGKPITLPTAPAPNRQAIEVEINKDNIVQTLQSGTIAVAAPGAPNANANTR